MGLPLMLRRTHRREYARQGLAYRSEITDLRAKLATAEEARRQFAADLVSDVRKHSEFRGDDVMIAFRLSRHVYRRHDSELARLIAERVTQLVYDQQRDWRGDLRQTPMQRALGL